jgi:hypothetical protein
MKRLIGAMSVAVAADRQGLASMARVSLPLGLRSLDTTVAKHVRYHGISQPRECAPPVIHHHLR